MKKILLLLVCVLSLCSSNAQGIGEWFNQNNTQRAYMLAQIAALQTYIGYGRKGYAIAKDGLNTISSIKNGDFNLHSIFINGYKLVNPIVRRYSRVADIIALQYEIISSCKAINKLATGSGFLTSECSYLATVCTNALNTSADNISSLQAVIVSGNLEMTDEERITQIDRIYNEQLELYQFIRGFGNNVLLLLHSKQATKNNLLTLKNWYQLK